MKKIIALFFMLLCFLGMVACNSNRIPADYTQSTKLLTQQGYVLYVTRDGFIANINAYGNVYVKSKDLENMEVYDTVIIDFYEADLFKESGTFEIAGETEEYSYMLEAVSVRIADPANGAPVFG